MTWAILVLWVMLSTLSGWFYRRGGSDKTWHGKERDWGCSWCMVFTVLWTTRLNTNLVVNSILLVVCFLLSWGALSTYWKGNRTDCLWYHWALHGAGVGAATLPLVLTVPWPGVLFRILFCSVAMTAVSEWSDDVVYEEWMRGIITTASVVFLW